MEFDKIIVTIFSLAGAALTYWFFLMKKDEVLTVEDSISSNGLSVDIVVEGGYSPQAILIPKDKTTKINFLRKDENGCLEEVVVPDFRIRKYLPLNQKVTVEIKPERSGEFKFSCGMNMFHGKIVVK